MNRKIYLITILLILVTLPSFAQQEAVTIPAYRGYVNDFANIINANDEQEISNIAAELEAKTTAQIAILTVPSTKPMDIAQFAVAVFEKWGIGTKEKDNGVLLLMAVNDRKVWIATGYGLEGAIPDAVASQISNQIMVPEFKQGNLSNGLLLGGVAVAHLVAKEYNITLQGTVSYLEAIDLTPPHPLVSLLRFLMTLVFFILIFGLRSGFLFYFLFGGMGRRRGGMWYGTGSHGTSGGFSGGFGGFGGGLTGGGGAGGSW